MVDLSVAVGSLTLPNPRHGGIGDRRPQHRTPGLPGTRPPRCLRHQVPFARGLGRQPRAAGPPDSAGMINSVGVQGPGSMRGWQVAWWT